MTSQTRIHTVTEIDKPIQQVFDYVTTPAHWPQWHPASLRVSGATDHSLQVGERVSETIRVAGRGDVAVWTVIEWQPPTRWVIEGQAKGGRATLGYRLTPRSGGTLFERELLYTVTHPVLRICDKVFMRYFMKIQSATALRRLKQRLEGG